MRGFRFLLLLFFLSPDMSKSSDDSMQHTFASLLPTLPVPNPTRSFWLTSDNNPLADVGSTGALTESSDVCIIGSGITGVSTAWHLGLLLSNNRSMSAKRIVILEARDFCSGATGRNGGHLTPNPFLGFRERVSLYGLEEALKSFNLESHTYNALLEIMHALPQGGSEVDLVEGGHTTTYLTTEEENSAKADHKSALIAGMDLGDVHWVSKDEMVQTHGVPFPAVRYPGHNLWPLKFVTHLYQLTKEKYGHAIDLRLHTRTPVTKIATFESSAHAHISSDFKWTLTTPRGSVHCSQVVHATNAYASHLLPHLAGEGGIIPVRGQVLALRVPLEIIAPQYNQIDQANRHPSMGRSSWGANLGFEYWFPRPSESTSNTLIILGGARDSALPHLEAFTVDDSRINDTVGRTLRGFLKTVFPSLKLGSSQEMGDEGTVTIADDVEMEWSGIMGFTRNGVPFVGPVVDNGHAALTIQSQHNITANPFEGQYVAAGFTGHGMSRAFGCAEALASLMVSRLHGEDPSNWVPPPWMPEHYLTHKL